MRNSWEGLVTYFVTGAHRGRANCFKSKSVFHLEVKVTNVLVLSLPYFGAFYYVYNIFCQVAFAFKSNIFSTNSVNEKSSHKFFLNLIPAKVEKKLLFFVLLHFLGSKKLKLVEKIKSFDKPIFHSCFFLDRKKQESVSPPHFFHVLNGIPIFLLLSSFCEKIILVTTDRLSGRNEISGLRRNCSL
jgi:hypothetical protein